MNCHNISSGQEKADRGPWCMYVLLFGVVALAVIHRFLLLRTAPGWYADEGTDIDIATHWMRGEQRYFAIGQSTLIAARPPLFHILLAGLFSTLGSDILTLRILTAGYGVLIVALLFILGRRMWGPNLALMAAAMYAIYPSSILYSRFGFLYNQVALLHLLLFYGLWRFINDGNRWALAGGCLSVGLAMITSVSSLPLVGFVVLVLLLKRRSALWGAIPLMALIPALYGGWMMIQAPQAFLYDLNYIFFQRVAGESILKLLYLIWNYKQLMIANAWLPLGALGLMLLNREQSPVYTQAFFWYNVFVTVTTLPAVVDLGFHYVVPILPWVAVGMASFVMWAIPRLIALLENTYDRFYRQLPWAHKETKWNQTLKRQGRLWAVSLIFFWMLISPFFAMGILPTLGLGSLTGPVKRVIITDVDHVERVAEYVNRHTVPDDVVLAPPHAAWMIESRAADFQQAVAYMGGETQNYPKQMDTGRFLFDCSVENARYALLFDSWREWAGEKMPDVETAFQIIEAWPVVYQKGDWRVYANPEKNR